MSVPECWKALFESDPKNWHNSTTQQPDAITVQFSNGQVHKTTFPIHLARWQQECGAVIIDSSVNLPE